VTRPLDIVVLGLSITSAWGNGHATTYRALLKGLAEAGHRALFLERDKPWYAAARDLPAPDSATSPSTTASPIWSSGATASATPTP